MRILFVSHTYLVAENRKKLRELASLPGVELKLVVPHRWPATMHGDLPYEPLDEASFPVLPLRAFLTGREMLYGYWDIAPALRPTPDVICVEQGGGAVSLLQFLKARVVRAPRAKVVFFTWWNLPYRARQPFRALEAHNLRKSDGAIAGNQEAHDILRDHGFKKPIRVLPQLGVDPAAFRKEDTAELRTQLGLGDFVVGFVGRFVPEKGLRVLVDAVLNLSRPAHLLLLGSGPLEAEIRQRINLDGRSKQLTIVNSVPHADVARYLNCMDALVLPSLTTSFWKEQFGHALIEAFACETPVVGSSSAEIPNVVGDAGLIVPEGDAEALCGALTRLADDASLRADLGRRGRERALAVYTNRKIAEADYQFFEELCR
jgi:glycosyltransferase involved in cell wall biosynthesis